MSLLRRQPGLLLLAVAFVASCYWVFTRSTPIVAQRPVTIRLAHWQIERGPPEGIAAAIRRYEELNPRVKVEQQLIPGPIYRQWLRSNLAGDNGPDIIEWGAWVEGHRDLPARYFAPITAELAKPNPYNRGTSQEHIPWEKTFHDGLIGPKRDSPDPGQIYAVTLTETTVRLYVNATLLRAITGSDAAPRTFDDLRRIFALTRRYAARTGQHVSALAGSRDNGRTLAETVFAGPLLGLDQRLDDDGYLYLYNRKVLAAYLAGRWNYHHPNVTAGLTLVREVAQAMKPGFLQLRRDDAMLEFFRGEALALFYGTWDATTLRQMVPFEMLIMKLPAVTPDDPEVGRYVSGPLGEGQGETPVALYLNKTTAHREEVIDFLRFLTSVPGNQLFTDHSLWLPAINGVKVPEAIKGFRDYSVGYAFGQAPYDALGSNVGMVWDRDFYHLTGDQGSVEQFAAALDRDMPVAIRADLKEDVRNTLLLVKPQDTVIIGQANLAAASSDGEKYRRRQAEVETSQTMSEGILYQTRRALDAAKERGVQPR